MTPEQTEHFIESLWNLLEAAYVGRVVDGKVVRLRDSEFRSGVMFLALAANRNGFVDMSHEEAKFVCGTDKHDTMRGHLVRLLSAGALKDKCLNGTARIKLAQYPGREMITHRSSTEVLTASTEVLTASTEVLTASTEVLTASTEVLTASTEVLTASTPNGEPLEKCAWYQQFRAQYQQFRALCQHFRAAGQHPSRNFDDYPQETGSIVVSKTNLSTSSEKVPNLLTALAQIDPLEEAMTVSLMLAVGGFWPKTVKEFAKKFPFELVRRAIGYWDDNRQSNGGTLRDNPGCVVTWLNDGEEMPPLSEAFKRTDLYLRHRTKAEIEADRRSEEEAAQWAAIEQAIDVTETAAIGDEPAGIEPDIDVADIWQQTLQLIRCTLAESIFNTWFAGTELQLRGTEFVATCSRSQAAQLSTRYIAMLKRSLSRVLGREVQVLKFEVKS